MLYSLDLGDIYSVGAGSTNRTTLDKTIGAVFIPSLQMTIPTSGTVTGWTFMNTNSSYDIDLQIWRFNSTNIEIEYVELYELIGETNIHSPSCMNNGEITKCSLLQAEQFSVLAGDLIGFYFLELNPIPYDVKTCYGTSDQLRYLSNIRDDTFSTVDSNRFSLVSYANNPCRDYSVEVTISK